MKCPNCGGRVGPGASPTNIHYEYCLELCGYSLSAPAKLLIIPVWDQETDEIIDMEVPEDFLKYLDDAEAERETRREENLRRERELSWINDD